ncbi:hypothetical protein [Rhizobium sp. CCGE 510]|uniref:hypothetical protein n=1 Tax=Rhizobium sp. CCGE 510 TaxID=1132836 RepID=UPI0012F6CDA2|nr:hypothetical protein [Rhizobium sp. CCGE 510]
MAIWHDIAPEGRDDFYAWHGEEHMPERADIPGFIRGRRYVATRAGLEFFNLYETSSPEVLKGSDYLSRLNSPTPWTTATVKHFRNVARSLCRVEYTSSHGEGGLIATLRYDVPQASAVDHLTHMKNVILPSLSRQPGIAGLHLLVADVGASAIRTEEQKHRAEANRIPAWVLLVEGWGDERPFEAWSDATLSANFWSEAGATGPADIGFYRLQNVRTAVSREP